MSVRTASRGRSAAPDPAVHRHRTATRRPRHAPLGRARGDAAAWRAIAAIMPPGAGLSTAPPPPTPCTPRPCGAPGMSIAYVAMTSINARMLDRELKKGSAELIILSIVEPRARHGYEICKLIEARSGGQLKFHVASLYPLLYRLEERGWLQGRWVEKPGQRRRRFYSLTAEGRRVLARQRDTWRAFVHAMDLITGADHA